MGLTVRMEHLEKMVRRELTGLRLPSERMETGISVIRTPACQRMASRGRQGVRRAISCFRWSLSRLKGRRILVGRIIVLIPAPMPCSYTSMVHGSLGLPLLSIQMGWVSRLNRPCLQETGCLSAVSRWWLIYRVRKVIRVTKEIRAIREPPEPLALQARRARKARKEIRAPQVLKDRKEKKEPRVRRGRKVRKVKLELQVLKVHRERLDLLEQRQT